MLAHGQSSSILLHGEYGHFLHVVVEGWLEAADCTTLARDVEAAVERVREQHIVERRLAVRAETLAVKLAPDIRELVHLGAVPAAHNAWAGSCALNAH